ncbi:MAG TPA: ATP-binding protein [Pyrinomonadaceae bacterium]|nr:ATP-binding protein [Pyrinomonadaceae bacterium]
MAERTARNEFEYSVATAAPTLRQRQLALLVVVVTLAAYGAVIPFATLPLQRFDGFIPAMAAIIFVTDLITAVLLFGQFSATGSRALLVLASGYLFTSLIAIPFALTFPGAFAPTGLLGAGPQTAAWFSISIRISFAVATVGYALLISGKHMKESIESSPRPAILSSVVIVIIMVGTLTWTVTAGQGLLPSLLLDGAVLPLAHYASGMIALTYILALLILWSRRKSVLSLWLMVAVCALIAESLVIAFLATNRFTLGFYANRAIPLVVSKVVLIVLLAETVLLHARLSLANSRLQREHVNKLVSAQAVVATLAHEVRQPLTGVTSRAAAGYRFLDREQPDIATAKRLFDQINDDAFRANEVFDSFLSLFKGSRQEHQPVDVNVLALEAVQLLRKELDNHNVTAHTMLAELPTIQGNRGQLREVILNLLQNSIEAMATTTRQRVISIVTIARDSDSVSLSLQDTGPGIDPDKLASIFDPFVTTKAKGTGLGLAICKMIIEQHGGKLSAASDSHYYGARFELTLPTKIAEPSAPATATEQSPRHE